MRLLRINCFAVPYCALTCYGWIPWRLERNAILLERILIVFFLLDTFFFCGCEIRWLWSCSWLTSNCVSKTRPMFMTVKSHGKAFCYSHWITDVGQMNGTWCALSWTTTRILWITAFLRKPALWAVHPWDSLQFLVAWPMRPGWGHSSPSPLAH